MMESPAEITEKKIALKNYITIWFICFLQFAGYGAVLVLQSSINIEKGTGEAYITEPKNRTFLFDRTRSFFDCRGNLLHVFQRVLFK